MQQPGESRSFSDWEEMRGGAVWRRTELPMHACVRACMHAFGCHERLGALIHMHHFYLLRESSQHASGGGQIHRDAQVVKRRREGGMGV